MGREEVEVTHLQYADNTIIFCLGELESLKNWWFILNVFLSGSGSSLNLSSTAMIGINVDNLVMVEEANILGCKMVTLSLLYLGFPLGGNPKGMCLWEPLIDKLRAKLDER